MGLLAKVADAIEDSLNERGIHTTMVAATVAAERILAIPEIAEALARKCDLCDETGKDTLRCNECAQIMASDY